MAVKSKPEGQPVPRIWPMWRDAEMVARIADRLRDGASEVSASLCEGMSDKTVAMWLSRWRIAMLAADEESEARGPVALTEFIEAVTPIARARGEWMADMERQALADDPGAQWVLPRRVADIYGTKQTIDIGSASPASEVAGLLDRIAEVRANEPG